MNEGVADQKPIHRVSVSTFRNLLEGANGASLCLRLSLAAVKTLRVPVRNLCVALQTGRKAVNKRKA